MHCFYQLVLWFLCTAAGCQEAASPAPEPQVPQTVTDAVRQIEEAGNKRDQATTKAREALRKAIEAALSGVRRRQGGSALEKAKDAGELEQDLAALDGAFVMPQSRLVRAAAAAFEKADVQARRDYRATVIRVAAGIASQHVEDSERLLRELDAEFPRSLAYDRIRSIDREITTVELLDGDYTLLVSGQGAAAESFPFRIRQGEPCIVDIHLRQPIPIELALDASALDKTNMPTTLIQIEEDGRLVTEDTVTPQSTRRPTLHALSLGAGTYTCTILNQRTRKTMAATTLTVAAGAPSQFPIALR